MSCQALFPALLLLGVALPCAAADQPRVMTPPPAGYHDVKIGKSVIRVKNAMKPTMHGGSDSSQNIDLGRTSPLSNKTFDTSFASLSKDDTAAEARGNNSFITHSFSSSVSSYNQSDRKFQTAAYKESARQSDDFNKPYALPAANSDADRTFNTKSSDLQGKTAQIAKMPAKDDPFATPSSLSEKTFFDPALKHVKHDPYSGNMDVKRLTDLPNRPLTIDEVRNLINHEQIPDLNSKPDEPSKPLNDPNWEPPMALPPARDSLPTAPPAELEKSGELPAPGEMAQPHPENSEPLPK